jgi:hypothetical protein
MEGESMAIRITLRDGTGESKLSDMQAIVLERVHHRRMDDLRELGEQGRKVIIDLGMMEPPLVDVRADEVFLTDVGLEALKQFIRS